MRRSISFALVLPTNEQIHCKRYEGHSSRSKSELPRYELTVPEESIEDHRICDGNYEQHPHEERLFAGQSFQI
jgi:hypothetical protein